MTIFARVFSIVNTFLYLFSQVSPSRLSCVALAFPMPICQHAFVSTYHANIRMTPFPAILSTLSASLIAIHFSPTIDAVTLSEVINRNNSALIYSEPLPRFPSSSRLTHSPIRSCHTITTTPPRSRTHALYILPATRHGTAHREVRNLLSYRRATAVGGHPTQPRLQVKTISVALPTATQTPISMFLVLPSLSSYTATETPFPLFASLPSISPCNVPS